MVSDPKKDSASEKPDRSDQDLRVLLLMLLLTVLVFALFLLRSNRPGDFEHARLAVVAGAEDAYSQAREDAPSWISRIADFATYVRDYGNAPVPPPIPKYVPKESLPVESVPPVSVVADFSGTLVPPVSTGASAGSSDIGTVPVTDS